MPTDFTAWTSGLVEECAEALRGAGACLVALTGGGHVPVVRGADLDDLCRYPVDRVALVPSTFGGMVVTSTGRGTTRVVCADTDGAVAALEGVPGRWHDDSRIGADADDHEVLALLWLLMDVRATRPPVGELVVRLLTWGWLAAPARPIPDPAAPRSVDAGLARLVAADLDGLAGLVGVELPSTLDAEAVRRLAVALGHPALDWAALPWVVTEEQRLDFLHACLPTRWALADELRTLDGRDDLAELVMAAPTPTPS